MKEHIISLLASVSLLAMVTMPIGFFKGGVVLAPFPTIVTTNTGGFGGTTSHTIPQPSGVVAGNLLISVIALNINLAITYPAGWTKFHERTGANISIAMGWRIATGSDTGNITTPSNSRSAMATYRITGASATIPPEGTSAVQSSTATPDPPSLTPTFGLKNTLWLAAVSTNQNASPTGYPTNYSLNQVPFGSSPDIAVAVAGRQFQGTSENPGTFTYAAAANSIPATIAISP